MDYFCRVTHNRQLVMLTHLKKIVSVLVLGVCACIAQAQTPILKPDLGVPSLVAPAYFGPNAFPVPDMLDGSTSGDLKVELYGDGFLHSNPYVLRSDATYLATCFQTSFSDSHTLFALHSRCRGSNRFGSMGVAVVRLSRGL